MTDCARGCTTLRHRTDCPDTDTCPGCLPRQAAPGLQVCERCETRTLEDLDELVELYDGLLEPSAGGMTQRVDGSPEPPEPLSSARRQTRERIRGTMVSWCMILHEDYRLTLPADDVTRMLRHVTNWTARLLGSEHADQLVYDVTSMAGEARALLNPPRSRGVRVACVGTTEEGERCDNRVDVTVTDPDGIVRCRRCGEWGTQEWWVRKAAPDVPDLLTATQARDYLLVHVGVQVSLATLRTWRHRGELHLSGRDQQGRALYDRVHVADVAQRHADRLSVA